MRVIIGLGTALFLMLVAPSDAAAHSRSAFVFGLNVPLFYGPPAYYSPYYAPPAVYYQPPVYYAPPPAVVTAPDCRPVTGRGETTGYVYEGIACRQPDGSWRVTPR